MANGFSDTSAFLRELTLKSMLILAPKVSLLSEVSLLFEIKLDIPAVQDSLIHNYVTSDSSCHFQDVLLKQ